MKQFYQYMASFCNFSPIQVIFIHYKSRIATAIRGLQWMKMTMVNSGLKGLTLTALKYACKNHTMETKEVFLNLKSSQLSQLALSDSFEYLCYGSTAIRNIFTLTVRRSSLDIDFRRENLKSTDVRLRRLKSISAPHGKISTTRNP